MQLKKMSLEDTNVVLDFWYEQNEEVGKELLDKALLNKYLNVICWNNDKIAGTLIFKVDDGYAEILELSFTSNEALAKLLWCVDKDMADGVTIFVREDEVKKQCGLRDVGGYKYIEQFNDNGTMMYKFEKEFRYATAK